MGLLGGFGYYFATRTPETNRHYFKFLKMLRDTTRNSTEQDTLREFCITPTKDLCEVDDSIQHLLENDEIIDLKQNEDN